MKIVHVVYSLEMGGAEVLVAQLCRIQRANGHDVSVCAYSKLGPIGDELVNQGIPVFVPGEAHPARTMLRYFAHFRRLRPDVVHMHNPAPTLQAALPARLTGTPCVVSTRHSLVAPPYDRREEVKFSVIASLACDWIVGICEITCRNLRGAPLAPVKRIRRVYNGVAPVRPIGPADVDPTFTDESAPTTSKPFTLLFVGRIAAVKDLGTLIRGFAIALKSFTRMRLWIVGDGPARQEMEALAGELGVADRVRFWGQRIETSQFYAAANCFVMSSVSEGLPMSLLQAMSAGVPSITTDVGGMAEVVGLSQSGLLTPVGQAEPYAEAILQMTSDEQLRTRLSANALTAYHQHFTLEEMDRNYMELYRSAGAATH